MIPKQKDADCHYFFIVDISYKFRIQYQSSHRKSVLIKRLNFKEINGADQDNCP